MMFDDGNSLISVSGSLNEESVETTSSLEEEIMQDVRSASFVGLGLASAGLIVSLGIAVVIRILKGAL